jgi:hypothetical protein
VVDWRQWDFNDIHFHRADGEILWREGDRTTTLVSSSEEEASSLRLGALRGRRQPEAWSMMAVGGSKVDAGGRRRARDRSLQGGQKEVGPSVKLGQGFVE